MGDHVLVSVTNGNPINLTALKIMLISLCSRSPIFDRVVIVCPDGDMPSDTYDWLCQRGVETRFYKWNTGDDPYKTKLLLIRFFEERRLNAATVLYLDPDHFIRDSLTLSSTDTSSLVVSSEFRVPEQPEYGILVHNNNSFIFGETDAWCQVLKQWASTYDSLSSCIPLRFREEVAFCKAASLSGITLQPTSNRVQSNFHSFDSNCLTFHYGGDSAQARRIKQCLCTNPLTRSCLNEVLKSSADTVETWAIKELIQIISPN